MNVMKYKSVKREMYYVMLVVRFVSYCFSDMNLWCKHFRIASNDPLPLESSYGGGNASPICCFVSFIDVNDGVISYGQ